MGLGPEGRFIVEEQLGEGTFGRVLACVDQQTQKRVAVKVVKGVPRYCEHAESEAEILGEILEKDPKREGRIVDMRCSFLHATYNFCIVFEPLDTSLRDFLKGNRSLGLLFANVWEISRQLLQSLSFLHSIGVTHTDLKCRNVMIRDAAHDVVRHPRETDDDATVRRLRSCDVVLIDFGGAVFPDERHAGRIGTRQFRAPEVVLGLPWDETSDLFSLGCILAMLYLGERPISVHEDMEHLALMEKLLGEPLPPVMLRYAAEAGLLPQGVHSDTEGRLDWPDGASSDSAAERVSELPTLRSRVCDRHHRFYDEVLRPLLEFDPRKRASAAAVLASSFFSKSDWPE